MNFPKIIWRYWDQGWENSPYIVQLCSKSLGKFAAQDFVIEDIDKQNLHSYVDVYEYIPSFDDYPVQIKADIIRLLLLKQYGGVWMDATVFLTKPLIKLAETVTCEFMCYFWKEDRTVSSNWFLISSSTSYILNKFIPTYFDEITSIDFLEKNRCFFNKWHGSQGEYFVFHRIFRELIQRDVQFKSEIFKMNFHSSEFAHIVQQRYGAEAEISSDEIEFIQLGSLQKLRHGFDKSKFHKKSAIYYLESLLSDTKLPASSRKHSYYNMRGSVQYLRYINDPEQMTACGAFATVGDCRVSKEKFRSFYVFNFQSQTNHAVQLLIPNPSNRLFIRHQQGNKFSQAREVAYQDQILALEARLTALEAESNRLFWEKILPDLKNEIDEDVIYSDDYDKSYYQFFIHKLDKKIHYELCRTRNKETIEIGIHFEEDRYECYAKSVFEALQLSAAESFELKIIKNRGFRITSMIELNFVAQQIAKLIRDTLKIIESTPLSLSLSLSLLFLTQFMSIATGQMVPVADQIHS